jgi:phenylalanyl-tRNA synthetase alpha chain
VSAPNSSFDPVEVADLSPQAVAAAVTAALTAIAGASDLAELKDVRLTHGGDHSTLALANREIGALPPHAKADAGKRVGEARAQVRQALQARQIELEADRDARVLVEEAVDVTLPYDRRVAGARHPLTTLHERIADVFVAMGWEIAEGPEVEAEWLNFDALNIGPDHPARTMQDTFFIGSEDSGVVLRTHTSPVQIRSLLDRPLPVYVICPGRVYRTDEFDATHLPVFHQVEGLVVDEGITVGDLKGTLDHFAREMFGPETKTRWRPSYFPFTEPSLEFDIWFEAAKGGPRWIEWGGCGIVNPRVLAAAGVDSDRYSGFAFGIGIDRTLMFANDVTDMRDMAEGDVRFTRLFGAEF